MFWYQMQKQIEHSENHIFQKSTQRAFWNLGTSILNYHFYHHHIYFSQGIKKLRFWFCCVCCCCVLFFFSSYFSNRLYFSFCKTLCRLLWLKQDLFPFTVSLSHLCHLEVHIHLAEAVYIPPGGSKPQLPSKSKGHTSKRKATFVSDYIQ